MRITILVPAFNLSGGVRVAAAHAERLVKRGHQVLAVTAPDAAPTFWQALRGWLRGRGWPAPPHKQASHFDGLPIEQRVVPHAEPVTDADVPDADVVLGTWWETVRWAAGLSPAKGVKVHFVQGYDAIPATKEAVDATYGLPVPKIVISRWLRELVRTRFGQEPVALVPNSVDTGRFFAPPRGKQPAPTVGVLYNNLAIKGCDVCFKAYELAAREVPGLRLRCISEIAVVPELPLPPGAEFNFQAREEKLREVYGGCDAWLSGSREEGFGLPILEAMACRTPVIATPAGAAPEILAKGGGILVPQEDAAAMARAIVQICALPDAPWRAMSDAALANATGYTWDDATDLLEENLKKLVSDARAQK
jgi:glycosyltransferase involved in cell wall biosynthesis